MRCPGHMSYTKVFSTMLDASVWREPNHVRIVWLTMLMMASKAGMVHASRLGLADRARVTPDEVDDALKVLGSCDPDDKSGVQSGIRVIPMQGCWQLVNFEFYRECKSIDAVRKAQWRARQGFQCFTETPKVSETRTPAPAPAPAPEMISSEPAAPAHDAPAIVRRVFEDWQKIFGHPTAKLDQKRALRIKARLKDFSAEQLLQALKGAAKDDWTMGCAAKSTRKYDQLETILRDTAQVERFIELEQSGPTRKASVFDAFKKGTVK